MEYHCAYGSIHAAHKAVFKSLRFLLTRLPLLPGAALEARRERGREREKGRGREGGRERERESEGEREGGREGERE